MVISYEDEVYVRTHTLMQFTIFVICFLFINLCFMQFSSTFFFSKCVLIYLLFFTFLQLLYYFIFDFNLHFENTLHFCHFIFVYISIRFTFKAFYITSLFLYILALFINQIYIVFTYFKNIFTLSPKPLVF